MSSQHSSLTADLIDSAKRFGQTFPREIFTGEYDPIPDIRSLLLAAADLFTSGEDPEPEEHEPTPQRTDYRVVNIQPGDVLVVHTDKRASEAATARIKAQLDAVAPGVAVLVIDEDLKLTHILRPQP